jgi:hypothetical protein
MDGLRHRLGWAGRHRHARGRANGLIPAASSSVGLAAIQIANRLHARPIALTRTSAKADALLGRGAAAVVATAEQEIVAEVKRLTDDKGADLVFDPVGGSAFPQLARATANGGTLILYGALTTDPTAVPPFDIFARDLTIRGLALPNLTRDDAQLAAPKRFVSDGLADGTLRPTIARTFTFDHIADAHRFIRRANRSAKSSSRSDPPSRSPVMSVQPLFTPVRMGDLDLSNRIVMAPLTRMRAGSIDHVPTSLQAEYYAQRASAGLIVAEATAISPDGFGWADTPGLWSAEQVRGWRRVTDAVHAAGGRIIAQLWHTGAIARPDM